MPARPRVRPGLRLLWRGPGVMQVGLAPGPAVVLAGVDEGDERLLSALDGSHDHDQLQRIAAAHGLGESRLPDLLGLLGSAGLLLGPDAGPPADRAHLARLGTVARARLAADADALALVHGTDGRRLTAARSGRHVVVDGAGRVGALVAGALAAAGVGRVDLVDERPVRGGDVVVGGASHGDVGGTWAAAWRRSRSLLDDAEAGGGDGDLGRQRGGAAHDAAVQQVQVEARRSRPPGREPDVVVLLAAGALDARVGDDLVRRDVAHLGVLVADDRVVVGPLVLPGVSACLRCLDLHRRDRDPAWPHLVAQLLTAGPHGAGATGETALSAMAAGLAALQVLNRLDGEVHPDAVGRTLEVSLPHGAVRRRSWPPHAGCGCARLQPDPTDLADLLDGAATARSRGARERAGPP